ncbi:hypothetical protein PDJAM_G00074100 [Pangasius djambal]|uniref:Uncharacterized protein n=1 Tax=Pangasius djambal TaxID=1691987 RepID=A0ACC5Z170_9TELE|nr:hypothetical protein [Pangasius djambal]
MMESTPMIMLSPNMDTKDLGVLGLELAVLVLLFSQHQQQLEKLAGKQNEITALLSLRIWSGEGALSKTGDLVGSAQGSRPS